MPSPAYKPFSQKLKDNYAAIAATFALVIALTSAGAIASGVVVTSKQIKNGSIKSQDLAKSAVRSSDLATNAVESSDIGTNAVQAADIKDGEVGSADMGANQVTPADVSLPAPVSTSPPPITGAVPKDGSYVLLQTVAQYSKIQGESVLDITWSGAVADGVGANCLYQLRVNGLPSPTGGGEVFASFGATNVSTSISASGVAAGPVEVQIWARAIATNLPNSGEVPTCVLSPTGPGVATTIVVGESVV